MTPERAEELKRQEYTTMTFDEATELCDAALRLASIENAGDEEVDREFSSVQEWIEGEGFASVSDGMGHAHNLRDLAVFNRQTAREGAMVIADLRERLGEAEKLLLEIKKFYGLKINPDGVPPWLWQIITESEVGSE